MISQLLNQFQSSTTLSVTDNFATFSVELELEHPFSECCESWISLFSSVPARDHATLSFTISGEAESTCGDEDSLLRVRAHIHDSTDEEWVRIKLTINKSVQDSALSVYSLQHFASFISNASVKDFLTSVSDRFTGALNFEVFEKISEFGSKTIRFSCARPGGPGGLQDNGAYKLIRGTKLALFRESCLVTGFSALNGNLLPSDLHLEGESSFPVIENKFNEACSILTLTFLANNSEAQSNGGFTYRFHGYKTVTYADVLPSEASCSCNYLYRIFEWCYEGGNGADKLGLVRNIVSIHLNADGKPQFDKQLLDAILSNYQIYLKGNIQSYLEVKNKIGELLVDFIGRASAISDDLLSSLKNNVAIIVTFLLTVVVVNGLKDNGESIIFSNIYLGVVFIVTAVSALWLWLLRRNLIDKFNSVSSSLKEIIKVNYGQVLLADEIDECVNPSVNKNRENLTRELNAYAKLWGLLLAAFLALYVFGNYLFVERSVPKLILGHFSLSPVAEGKNVVSKKITDQSISKVPAVVTPTPKR